ncbi:MAG: tail fiber domain-containing protein [Candidatus Woesebacteria bacterium]|nr:MAG: tail fiber domain-containing protein [Candidatus Woesebacteria bacterium]
MTANHLRIQEAANILGISSKTLRRWNKSGKLVPEQISHGGQRFYTKEQLINFRSLNTKTNLIPNPQPKQTGNDFKTSHLLPTIGFVLLWSILFTILGLGSLFTVSAVGGQSDILSALLNPPATLPKNITKADINSPSVLAAESIIPAYTFNVNLPAKFSDSVTFLEDITVPNVIYSLKAGDGISITTGQTPTIKSTVALTAGDGITIDGFKVTNSSLGSSQNIFKTISVSGQSDVVTDTNTDTLTFAGSGVTITTDATADKITFTAVEPDYTLSGWTDSGTSVGLTTTTDSVVVDGLTFGNATITSGKKILPSVDLGADLGSSSYRFNNLYVANINSNSSQSFSGQTTFSYEPTATTLTQASVLINPTTSVANGQLLALGIAGYQKALIDEDGDIILGYSDATSAPASDYPLNIYGHSGTQVAYIDTTGLANVQTLNLANNAITSGGALTITPAAGSNLNVALSTTGDLAVNTDDLYVDTSTGRVGIGTTTPETPLQVKLEGLALKLGFSGSGGNSSYMSYNGYGFMGYDYNGGNLNMIVQGVSGTGIEFNVNNSTFGSGTVMQILTNGNVGIGTTAPTSKLHVSGAVTGKALAIFDETGDQNILVASASGSPKFVIDHSGNVGIGTTTPGTWGKLEIVTGSISYFFSTGGLGTTGNVNPWYVSYTNGPSNGSTMYLASNYMRLYGGSTGTNGTLQMYTGSTEKMRIDGSGLVGIGTTSPTSLLHVSGKVTGKALAIFDETGDQDIFTASGSGTTRLQLSHAGTLTSWGSIVTNGTENGGTGTGLITINNSGGLDLYVAVGSGAYITARPSYPLYITSGILTVNSGTSDMYFKQNSVTPITSEGTGAVANTLYLKTGNVGIGTTNPASKLSVIGSGSGETVIQVTSGVSGSTSSDGFFLGYAADNNILVWGKDGNSIKFGTTDIERLRLSNAGGLSLGDSTWNGTDPGVGSMAIQSKLGIGTSSPTSKLHLTGAVTGKALAIFDETGDQNILVASASGTNRLTLTNAGRLGVGTSSPTAILHTNGTNQYLGEFDYSGSPVFTVYLVTGGQMGLFSGSNSLGLSASSPTGNPHMTIATTGNVGIGTSITNPTSKLHVGGSVTGKALAIFDETGDQNIITASASGVGKFVVTRAGSVGIGTTNPTSASGFAPLLHIAGDNPGIVLQGPGTYEVGAGSTGGVKWLYIGDSSASMRWGVNGVGVGPDNSPDYFFDVQGNLHADGTVSIDTLGTGTVYSNAGVLTNVDPSDKNLKQNIVDLSSGTLEKVLGLKPVSYNWKSTDDGALGFIAQDVEQVFPELVGHNNDGTLGLFTTQFIPVLTKAIQEQQLQIDEIKLSSASATITNSDWGALTSLVNSIKTTLSEVQEKLTAMADEIFTKKIHTEEICVGTVNNETCVNKEQLDSVIKLLPTPTPLPTAAPNATDSAELVTPSPTPTSD